jgi:hypothetical protein
MRKIYLVLLTIRSTLFCSCHKDHNNPASPPTVVPALATATPTYITASTAVSGGSFTTDGTLTITSRGIEYDTSNSFPNHWTVTSGNGIGTFTSSGVVSTLAGTGASGSLDGNSAIATFNNPIGPAIDNSGNVFVADASNNKIRKISPL